MSLATVFTIKWKSMRYILCHIHVSKTIKDIENLLDTVHSVFAYK